VDPWMHRMGPSGGSNDRLSSVCWLLLLILIAFLRRICCLLPALLAATPSVPRVDFRALSTSQRLSGPNLAVQAVQGGRPGVGSAQGSGARGLMRWRICGHSNLSTLGGFRRLFCSSQHRLPGSEPCRAVQEAPSSCSSSAKRHSQPRIPAIRKRKALPVSGAMIRDHDLEPTRHNCTRQNRTPQRQKRQIARTARMLQYLMIATPWAMGWTMVAVGRPAAARNPFRSIALEADVRLPLMAGCPSSEPGNKWQRPTAGHETLHAPMV
jgi:hypothetical protein